MFDIFKQDIITGDRIRLSLITGKEPEGVVLEIGNNFVRLESDDKTKGTYLDKMIGGWEVLLSSSNSINEQPVEQISPLIVTDYKRFNICSGNNQIDKESILSLIGKVINDTPNTILSKTIAPNANIISVMGTTCIASNQQYPQIRILYNTIIEKELLSEIESFSIGSIIPIFMLFYQHTKKNTIIPTLIIRPNSIGELLSLFKKLIINEKYEDSKRLTYILKYKDILPIQQKKIIVEINHKLKNISVEKNILKINIQQPENKEEKRIFKQIEKRITDLLKQGEFLSALLQIDKELNNNSLDNKYKSSLLLKKAQTYSSLNNPTKSEEAYRELIDFNEKAGSSDNNLSHLYTELARLQSLNIEKQTLALESVKRALIYNPNNNYANNLLTQFQGKSVLQPPIIKINTEDDENLIVEAEDDSTVISKMIDIDIREHKFTNPDILKNAGKPTAFIAKQIFEIAKDTRDIDLSERYPLYLEAAKAFSELNVGSYDFQDYLESVAYYAMLKGNSLFINFRNKVQSDKIDINELTRLKDSACSYYMESLNLLSNIKPKLLLIILSNYLKLNIVFYKLSHKEVANFEGNFSNVFFDSIRSKDKELEQIAYQTIVSIGATSASAWNQLTSIQGGTGHLYGEFGSEERKEYIYTLINRIENSKIDNQLSPSLFLKKAFQQRRQKELNFEDAIAKVISIALEPHNILQLIEKWDSLIFFSKLLSTTDLESKEKVDKILSILKPYLNRNQTERTNLLIQAKRTIESQLKFIASNTTIYGRTLFFPLLDKWRREIDALLEEKIAQSYPSLEIIIDPQYFVNTKGVKVVNTIIKNNGETTAEGFELEIIFKSAGHKNNQYFFSLLTEDEIPAGEQASADFAVPIELLTDSQAIEIEINAVAIYQKKKIEAKNYQFTVEEEPKLENVLTYNDIVWKDGPIPEKHLFIGRQQIISNLAHHYKSVEKDKPYILYGLTRTGKSSILKYLKENLQGDIFVMKSKEMTLLPFSWDLSEAASFNKESDFWEYILSQQIVEKIDDYNKMYNLDFSGLSFPQTPRAKDFPILLNYFQTKNIYPLFLVDEFSFIKTLIDGEIINAAFLHTLRQHSLNGLASFIYAGTYDIKQLISNPKYGITGQLVNAIEEQINEISDKDATTLIEAMKNKLIFTSEAISHIKVLSGNVPYFIQIICKYCGYYASENGRRYIGYPELEKVIKILTGKEEENPNSLVKNLPENIFQNNQFSPADPKEVNVLISSIAHFNREKINNPRGVGFDELQRLWAEKGVIAFRPKLADAINLLRDKKILIQKEDEGVPVYKFEVDLFRRWWTVHHSDIDLEITTII